MANLAGALGFAFFGLIWLLFAGLVAWSGGPPGPWVFLVFGFLCLAVAVVGYLVSAFQEEEAAQRRAKETAGKPPEYADWSKGRH